VHQKSLSLKIFLSPASSPCLKYQAMNYVNGYFYAVTSIKEKERNFAAVT